jgi:hypothetical protein
MGESQEPPVRVEGGWRQFIPKVLANRSGKRIGFPACQFNGMAVGQYDAVAHHPQVNRVCAKPIGFTGCSAIGFEGDWGDGPVLLARYAQRLAQRSLHAFCGADLSDAACQQCFQRRQAQALRGGFKQTRRREKMGNEQQHVLSVTKRIR